MVTSRITTRFSTLILILSAAIYIQPATSQDKPQPSRDQSQQLSGEQIAAVVLAIEDEVYDNSQQKAFYDVGISTEGPTGRSMKISLYINQHLASDGMGEAIYKNMPYGEIIRVFHVAPDGLVVLAGGPQIGFPVTQPSHLTVFMDDDELCEDKARWLHSEFTIMDNPPKELVIRAARRQNKRVGFSNYLKTYVGRDPK